MQANIQCAHTKQVELKKLKPHPSNENKHSERQIKALAKIIAKVGQRSPIVVSNRSGFITKGHGRLEAMKLIGWDNCAVDFQDYKDELEELNDRVADNEIARYAEFDLEKFQLNLKELNLELGELDLEEYGLLDLAAVDVNETTMPDLNSGAKGELEQITFTLHTSQADEVRNAIEKAKELGEFGTTGNENNNGNALARICEWFVNHGIS